MPGSSSGTTARPSRSPRAEPRHRAAFGSDPSTPRRSSRGRGYASALTAELTAQLLSGGRDFCFLYTDLANPTANSIYQRVGYRPVTDVELWRFDAVK